MILDRIKKREKRVETEPHFGGWQLGWESLIAEAQAAPEQPRRNVDTLISMLGTCSLA